jgi:hypothetical protein
VRTVATAVMGLALAALLPAACFNPTYGNGHLACTSRCPDGFVCSSGRCWVKGQVPEPPSDGPEAILDAAPPPEDGAPPAPDLARASDTEQPAPGPDAESTPDAPEPALLQALLVSGGKLAPDFSPEIRLYEVDLPLSTQSVTVTASPAALNTELTINNMPLAPDLPSAPQPLDNQLSPRIVIVATAPDGQKATYKITLNRGSVTSYVKASRVAMGDHFGRTVALSQDTLVVGAPDEDSGAIGIGGNQNDDTAPSSGAAYVFLRSHNSWTQQAFIKPPNTTPDMTFGSSVAIAGDTLVVGAPTENGGTGGVSTGTGPFNQDAIHAGAAYVYTRSNGGWTLQAYLKPQITSAGDQFGTSVAISGNTIAVGAIGETGVNGDPRKKPLNLSGAVYLFVRTGTTWMQQNYLKAPGGKAEIEFGSSVALAGDTLVAGAPKEDSGGVGTDPSTSAPAAMDSGAAYVFVRNGSGMWPLQTTLKPSNTTPGVPFAFGSRVAIDGDLVAVGAPLECGARTNTDLNQKQSKEAGDSATGAVYLYRRTGTNWNAPVRYVKAPNAGGGDHFGEAVALGPNLLVVGAPGEDGSGIGVGGTDNETKPDSGAAYVFNVSSTGVTLNAYLKATNSDRNEAFGRAIAISGSIIAIGADNEGGSSSGVDDERQNVKGLVGSGAVYTHF